MKKVLAILTLSCSFFATAEYVPYNYYSVTSDSLDITINPGVCKVSGKVIDVNSNPVSAGLISNLDRSRFCYTSADGTYTLTLSSMDTAIFFYHENYGEIVIWNYPFQSQHRVKIDFVTMEHSDYQMIQEKPVIYLYADEPTQVDLSLRHNALTFTYPAYDNGWQVTTCDGGMVDNKTGKKHPYLFWEGKADQCTLKKTNNTVAGTLIETSSVVTYLENTLAALGLNATETTDFITYWGPRLMQKEYAFIQFLTDEEVDETIADLQVTPQPESYRRVYMLFTLLDEPQVPFEFDEQIFTGFSRNGLTLVEWGGSEISFRNLLP